MKARSLTKPVFRIKQNLAYSIFSRDKNFVDASNSDSFVVPEVSANRISCCSLARYYHRYSYFSQVWNVTEATLAETLVKSSIMNSNKANIRIIINPKIQLRSEGIDLDEGGDA